MVERSIPRSMHTGPMGDRGLMGMSTRFFYVIIPSRVLYDFEYRSIPRRPRRADESFFRGRGEGVRFLPPPGFYMIPKRMCGPSVLIRSPMCGPSDLL